MGKSQHGKQSRRDDKRFDELVSKYQLAAGPSVRQSAASPLGRPIMPTWNATAFAALSALDGGPSRDSVTRAVRGVLGVLDEALSRAPKTIVLDDGEVRGLACRDGCFYCCSNRVTTTAPFVLVIADDLRSRAEAMRPKMHEYTVNKNGLTPLGFAKKLEPCPLLSPEKSCSIYAVRPPACREYHSYMLQRCIEDYEDADSQPFVPQHLQRKMIQNAVLDAFFQCCEQVGIETRELEFIHAVQLAMAHADPWRAWLEGEDIFASAHRPEVSRQHLLDTEKRHELRQLSQLRQSQ